MAVQTSNCGSSLLDALANYLQDVGVARIGVDLFVLYMPEEAERGIVLIDNQVYGLRVLDRTIPNYAKSQLRIVSRAPTYKDAFAMAQAAADEMVKIPRGRMGNVEIKLISQINPPLGFPPSMNTKAKEVVVNFSAVFGLIA
jgi:hypothetical protein